MDVEQIKEDVRQGRIDVDRLVELIVTLERQLHAAKRRIEELEQKLGGSTTTKVDEPFSVRAEERRQAARGKTRRKRNRPARRGRITSADKIAQAVRTEKVFPAGVPEEKCRLSHTRPVLRLENGQAVFESPTDPNGGTFTCCVTGLTKSGYPYQSGDNEEDCDNITNP